MKFLWAFVCAFVILAAVASAQGEDSLEAEVAGPQLVRMKRATCPWLPGACSVHCKTKGFTRGYCDGGTCKCTNTQG